MSRALLWHWSAVEHEWISDLSQVVCSTPVDPFDTRSLAEAAAPRLKWLVDDARENDEELSLSRLEVFLNDALFGALKPSFHATQYAPERQFMENRYRFAGLFQGMNSNDWEALGKELFPVDDDERFIRGRVLAYHRNDLSEYMIAKKLGVDWHRVRQLLLQAGSAESD